MNLSSIKNHLQHGTFLKAAKEKISRQFSTVPPPPPSGRWHITSVQDAIGFLAERASVFSAKHPEKKLYLIAQQDQAAEQLLSALRSKNISPVVISPDGLQALSKENPSTVSCVVAAFFDAKNTMRIGKFLITNESTREIPFEFILVPNLDFGRFEKYDHYKTTSFTSPLFAGNIDFTDIYEESLTKFQQKCDIRDYMDLCQTLSHVAKNKIPGEVAEFGSFRGHSGYLIVQTLKRLGVEKKIMLFDMFEAFPSEGLGVDYFWEEHNVDFEEVKSKLSPFKNVELVKGDFTETILNYPDVKLSFVFMDCDSYRATKFLVEHLFEKQLSVGGMMVFEDYGHPALLGNRLAVHECFDNRKNCFTFYSQFSGFYIVVKTS